MNNQLNQQMSLGYQQRILERWFRVQVARHLRQLARSEAFSINFCTAKREPAAGSLVRSGNHKY